MSDAADQLFLGRQAILDREQRLFAYELLFRSSETNAATVLNHHEATVHVVARAFDRFHVAKQAIGQIVYNSISVFHNGCRNLKICRA